MTDLICLVGKKAVATGDDKSIIKQDMLTFYGEEYSSLAIRYLIDNMASGESCLKEHPEKY